MAKILVVEDDHDLSDIIQFYLKRAGHIPVSAYTCAEAEKLLEQQVFDLLILDVVLPDRKGLDLCTTVRKKSLCPIIFTSCLDDSQTIVNALQFGGDDYMVKPLNYEEMIARIESNLRRYRPACQLINPNLRQYPGFTIDTSRRRVLIPPNQEVLLSSTEYNLLLYFSEHPNTLLLYNDLYRQIWKTDSIGDTRTVMVHISNLRKKIDPHHSGIIQTVRGAGYIFNATPLNKINENDEWHGNNDDSEKRQ